MSGPTRDPKGATISFCFDGKTYKARAGDTLAAALLANGVGLVGRSFKYHRPRGIMTAGIEEPNALVTVGDGGRAEPNTRATDVFVYDGLIARSQNRWPNLRGMDEEIWRHTYGCRAWLVMSRHRVTNEISATRAAGPEAPP